MELLAPGGDVDAIKAAIAAGADAIYCGLEKFNARNRATNISFENLHGILHLAHQNNCEVFITLNILIVESEIPAFIKLLNKLIATTVDGVIIQDLGMFYLISKYFKSLKIHASTQMTTHNAGQIQFLHQLNAQRVNLSRELNLNEIKTLVSTGKQHNMLSEVFVHGSNCISFSGLCYMSSVHGGNSGNRGRCSQPCRDKYMTTTKENDYPLNLKDNAAYFDIKELADVGVDSLKIEGRIKKYDYIYTVVSEYKAQLKRYYKQEPLSKDTSALYKVFNRDFTNGFLKGNIGKDLFINNPRDNAIKHLLDVNDYADARALDKAQLELYAEKEAMKRAVEEKISQLNINKIPLSIHVSGQYNKPLKVVVTSAEYSFEILSDLKLHNKGSEALSREVLLTRLKTINKTGYYIDQLNIDQLHSGLYLPFKALTRLKKQLLLRLNGTEIPAPVVVPCIKKVAEEHLEPSLMVLTDSPEDLKCYGNASTMLYYQLPNGIKAKYAGLIALFKTNKQLIPWFPSVLIGEDYAFALQFLHELQPESIVTNNTGIAYTAYKMGIAWVAGPYLNITNSYSLVALKELLNCTGAFISNELSLCQLKAIKKPENFKLYYSIYHPVVLMTSRQCLFYQVTGCDKHMLDNTCLSHCEKLSSITNVKQVPFVLEKSKGNYHNIYNAQNFLNAGIVVDLPNVFDHYCIDLRCIKTSTEITVDKVKLIQLFKNVLKGLPNARWQLDKAILHTNNSQYKKGI